MFLKVVSVLAASAGVTVPVTVAVKSATTNVLSPLEKAESIVRLEWVGNGNGLQKEVGKLIDGFGKVIHGEDAKKQASGEVIGIELRTSGTFNKNICEELGFSSNKNKDKSLGCRQSLED